MRVTTVLTVGLLLVLAAPAGAATVKVETSCGRFDCAHTVRLIAAPGERNVVNVEPAGDRVYTLRDTGAPLTPGRNCRANPDASVTCVAGVYPDPVNVVIELGDGDDVGAGTGVFYGEAGNDRITGNGSGGPGNDVLMAQRGWFFDDDGPTRGHDVYRSWGGDGLVSYERRRTGVLVDLRPGQRSEDRLEGIPRVIGGEGKDVLIGDDARNVFEGGPGSDRLVGGAGDDVLVTGPGDDDGGQRVDAGPGRDHIVGSQVDVRCGPDPDTVVAAVTTLLRPDCESVGIAPGTVAFALSAELPALDAPILTGRSATGRWHARFRGALVGSVRPGGEPADLRLNAAGRRLLRRHRQLVLDIRQDSRYAPGFRLQVRWTP